MDKQSSMIGKLLRRRVHETYGSHTPPIDELIDGLRAKYPEYRRYKPQLFTRMVKQTLDSRKRKLRTDDESFNVNRKKTKKIDVKEERFQKMELQTESPELELESNKTRAVLTSEDEVYIQPEIDLAKSNKSVEQELVTEIREKRMMEDHKASSLVNDDGVRFEDLGGIDGVLDELHMKVFVPVNHPHVPRLLGVRPTAGILLHGPPGCGKTTLANALANEAGVPFYQTSATELVSGVSGASEENIRELFSKAHKTAPSIVFIDEIDAIASKRENLQREMERRIVTQLMSSMDATSKGPNGKSGYVLVIGATNRPDVLDPGLRRPGRFDCEITLGVPDENARTKILSVLTRNVKLEGDFDLVKITRSTPGFVGADLEGLVNEAGNHAMKRFFYGRKLGQNEDRWRKALTPEEMDNLSITMSDFEGAAKLVQPSLTREGFSSIPDVKWEDIGGLDSLRREFYTHIISPIKYPDECEDSGSDLETGFLLLGPPGCGKTLIAKAVANEAGANFIHIKGPELLNKYVGESELAVRTLFSRARACAPCILFFDEVDSLTTKGGTEGSWVVNRLLNQLLLELDGGDQRKGVYVIGATNKPDMMDPAIIRPGRFGELKYVSLPNQDERVLILKALSKNRRLDADVDFIAIAQRCVNFSGADLSKLMRKAALAAREEKNSKIESAARERASVSSSQSYLGDTPLTIRADHFEQAFGKVSPSASEEVKHYFDLMAKRLGAT